MSKMSGIRSIMEDIATAAAEPAEGAWLNLSPGNPALIPQAVATWRQLAERALAERFVESGRYGPTRGANSLVSAIVRYFNTTYGWPIGPENVVVSPGSQLLCFMATTIFTGPGDAGNRPLVLLRLPDYAGYQGLSLAADGIVGVEPVVIPQGDRYFQYGVNVAALRGQADVGMMLVSNPANPAGSLDRQELDAVVAIAAERDVPLLVDNAYGEPFPRVADTKTPPVWHPNVINTFTLSKAGLPGERMAFAIGSADAIRPMVAFLANAALHAPQLVQSVAEAALESRRIDALTTDVIRPYYRAKRRVVEEMLFERLPDSINWRLHSGDGGLFCWLWIDEDWFDDVELYHALKRKKVLVVPGRHFFIGPMTTPFLRGHGTRCVRLSMSDDEWCIAEGISRLSETLTELRDARRPG
ncbi:MAG TPA: aminotransferase class I/II-fold pyridoxal phosphate-dependent enzyme [Pseudonocardiaceae bacterium]